MTWSKVSQTAVNVSAYSMNFADGTTTIRLGVGTAYVDLTPEDAGSLGGYLLSYAPDKAEEPSTPE